MKKKKVNNDTDEFKSKILYEYNQEAKRTR